jgi:hypothetical protein
MKTAPASSELSIRTNARPRIQPRLQPRFQGRYLPQLIAGICIAICAGFAILTAAHALRARMDSLTASAEHGQLLRACLDTDTAIASASLLVTENVAQNDATLVADVSAALTGAGVPVARMTSLSPSAASPRFDGGGSTGAVRLSDGGTVHRVQRSASMTLEDVTLPELGGFLREWNRTQPAWRVASIQITPQPLASSQPLRSTALAGNVLARPLSLRVTMETSTLERGR